MASLSQRLLHTSLPHRMGPRMAVRYISNPSSAQLALSARNLIQSPEDSTTTEPERRFQPNQIYPPHEFTQPSLFPEGKPNPRAPLLGPPNKVAKQIDPFHLASSDPLDHILNPGMSRAFINQMGRIKSRAETGLTWKNQRKVGKLVRRARAMGLISRWTDRGPSDDFRY